MNDLLVPDWNTVRDDFPALQQKVHRKPLVNLDNAATDQRPRSVIDELSRFHERPAPASN